MKTIIGLAALALFLDASNGSCNAQMVVKQEPMMLNRGAVVLVDDGSCPKGQIKQVTAQVATVTDTYRPLERKCIRR
jgi:hypothetical protein